LSYGPCPLFGTERLRAHKPDEPAAHSTPLPTKPLSLYARVWGVVKP
jgi:hypothetical protein